MDNSGLDGKRIVITGGTGSIGKALIQHILGGGYGAAKKITIFSRDENKQWEMSWLLRNSSAVDFVIGDVRNYDSIARVLATADILFHCAAMKHVSICEDWPTEAAMTNITGAENIARFAANEGNLEAVIGCSTDKACEPVSIMGLTKAIQERIFILASRRIKETRFVICRFGNIPGSSGSVIPLFKRQIFDGGQLTVTNPMMTRFLLWARRAAQIMIEAASCGKSGEIFIPIMPACAIGDLAQAMISLYGKGSIKVIGSRSGEKEHEIIISNAESRYATLFTSKAFGNERYVIGKDPVCYGGWQYQSNNSECLIIDRNKLSSMLISEGVLP